MTVDEHLRFVSATVNERMHPGHRCPGAGALGECAAISELKGASGHSYYVASLYLWPAAMDLQPATVAAWFAEADCEDITVSAVLHQPINGVVDGVTSDRVWPWEVSFTLQHHAAAATPAPVAKYDDVLMPFLALMRKELHANSGKGDRPGWLSMSTEEALLEVYYHLAKLQKAVRNNDGPGIQEYSADVANMTMMVLDICGGLAWADSAPDTTNHQQETTP